MDRRVSTRRAPAARLRMLPVATLVLSWAAAVMAGCSPVRPIPTATPVLAGPSAVVTHPAVVASATPGPFQIELPARGAPPITDWRPPLYPAPWAIAPYDHFYFTRPIAANEINWPLANYRYGGVFFENVVHTGVDIDAPLDTPILAAGPGTVVWADWGLFLETPGAIEDPYGMAVVIRMEFGYKDQPLYTVYAHMSKIIAIRGQHVNTGDVLGLVGATGATTGPHVHFEVRWAENSFHHTYNPELWMVPPEGWGVLVGRLTDSTGDPIHLLDVQVQNTVSGQTQIVRTYGGGAVNSDPYYGENLVLSDLPAGLYKISFTLEDQDYQNWAKILPGQVTYFTYNEKRGFKQGPPPTPEVDGLPSATP